MKFGNLLYMLSAHNQHFQVLYQAYKQAKKRLKRVASNSTGALAQQQQGDFAAELVHSISQLAGLKSTLQQQCQQRMQELQAQQQRQLQQAPPAAPAPLLVLHPPAEHGEPVTLQHAEVHPAAQVQQPVQEHLQGLQGGVPPGLSHLPAQHGQPSTAEGSAAGGSGDEDGEVDGLHQTYRDAVHFHGEVLLVMNWSMLAYTMCLKILKKHNKRTGMLLQAPELRSMLSQPSWSTEDMAKLVCAAEELVSQIQQVLLQRQQQQEQQLQLLLSQQPAAGVLDPADAAQLQQLQPEVNTQPQQQIRQQQDRQVGLQTGQLPADLRGQQAQPGPLVRGLNPPPALAPVLGPQPRQVGAQGMQQQQQQGLVGLEAAHGPAGGHEPLLRLSSAMSWSSRQLVSQMHSSSWDDSADDDDDGADGDDDDMDGDDEGGDDNSAVLDRHAVLPQQAQDQQPLHPRQQGRMQLPHDAAADSTSEHDTDSTGSEHLVPAPPLLQLAQSAHATAAVAIPVPAPAPAAAAGTQRLRSRISGTCMAEAVRMAREQGISSTPPPVLPSHGGAPNAQVYSWDCLDYVSGSGSCSPPLGTSPMSDEGIMPLHDNSPRATGRKPRSACGQCGGMHDALLPPSQRLEQHAGGAGRGRKVWGAGPAASHYDDEVRSPALPVPRRHPWLTAMRHREAGHMGDDAGVAGPRATSAAPVEHLASAGSSAARPCSAGMKRYFRQRSLEGAARPQGAHHAAHAAAAGFNHPQLGDAAGISRQVHVGEGGSSHAGAWPMQGTAGSAAGVCSAALAAAAAAGSAAGMSEGAVRLSHNSPHGSSAEMVLQMQLALQAWEFLAHGSSTPSTVLATAPAAGPTGMHNNPPACSG